MASAAYARSASLVAEPRAQAAAARRMRVAGAPGAAVRTRDASSAAASWLAMQEATMAAACWSISPSCSVRRAAGCSCGTPAALRSPLIAAARAGSPEAGCAATREDRSPAVACPAAQRWASILALAAGGSQMVTGCSPRASAASKMGAASAAPGRKDTSAPSLLRGTARRRAAAAAAGVPARSASSCRSAAGVRDVAPRTANGFAPRLNRGVPLPGRSRASSDGCGCVLMPGSCAGSCAGAGRPPMAPGIPHRPAFTP